MKKNFMNSYLVPTFLIMLGGLLIVAIAWLLYLGIYLFIEQYIYQGDNTLVRADMIRNSSTLILCIVAFLVSRTKTKEIIKAIFFVGALTTVVIAVMLRFYVQPWKAVMIIGIIAILLVIMNFYFKKPWFYYLVIIYSITLGLLYAWPQG